MNALQIKCYLLPECEQLVADLIAKSNEIRRFVLAQGLSGGVYEQLLAKIRSSFGSLVKDGDQIKTYYLDEENEFVCFSTDSELQYAVDLQTAIKMSSKPYETSQNLTNGLFKVFVVVREKPTTNSKQEQEQSDLHPGVVCDGCEKDIFGIRYKCMMCPDYDLCRDCREKGIHPEHTFIPITKPARRCMFPGKHRGFHGHGWKHRFNHYHQHHHQQQQQEQQQNGQAAGSACGSRHHNPLQDTLNNFLPFIANSIPIVNDPEQLKSVGEYLKQFFDPFGIDVSYYVDNINNMRSTGASTSTTQDATTASAAAKASEETKTAESQPAENLMETTSDLEKTLGSEILVPSSPEKSSPEIASTSSITVTPLVPSAPVKQDLIDLKTKEETETMSEINTSPFEMAANALKNVIQKSQTNEEQNDNMTSGAMGTSSTTTTSTTSVKTTTRNDDEDGFNLVDIEKELKFINCIEQLRSMGYNDDAGWLTRLVIAKEGNINAVLDSMHPLKY